MTANVPPEAYAAADAALDALPQPESRFERDRWRMISHIALDAAAPILAEVVAMVTRFEVINHTKGAGSEVHYIPDAPRSVVAYGIKTELSLQDEGRTLKVFLTDQNAANPLVQQPVTGEETSDV